MLKFFYGMQDAIVIIPTYNELENIEDVIRAVFSQDKAFDILVVDDNSPDSTASRVKQLQKEFSKQLFLEVRKEKFGLGTAYIHGFKWCLDKGYQYIFEMDADFSHDPKDLVKLHAACHIDGADLAIGSRYITGVNVVNCQVSVHVRRNQLVNWLICFSNSWHLRRDDIRLDDSGVINCLGCMLLNNWLYFVININHLRLSIRSCSYWFWCDWLFWSSVRIHQIVSIWLI